MFRFPKEADEYIKTMYNIEKREKKEKKEKEEAREKRKYIIVNKYKQTYKTRTDEQKKEYHREYQIDRRKQKINCPNCNRDVQIDYLKRHMDNYICVKNS